MAKKGRATLVLSPERSGHERAQSGEVFAVCEAGIPFGWFLLFGGRNFAAPDESIAARGGASADRNRFETRVDVAEPRLQNASAVLCDVPTLHPWVASLPLLHRRIKARGAKGFLRLDAPWAFASESSREELFNQLAFAENIVNISLLGRFDTLPSLAASIEHFAPFVPHGEKDDAKRFAKAPGYPGLAGARRAAAMIGGLPELEVERYLALVDEQCAAAFASLESLVYPRRETPTGEKGAKSGGLLGRLRGMFGG